MKKTLLTPVVIIASSIAAMAQSLTTGEGKEINIYSNRSIESIPGCWTSAGKSYITDYYESQGCLEQDINIYSLHGDRIATINKPYDKVANHRTYYTEDYKATIGIASSSGDVFQYLCQEEGENYGKYINYEKDSTGIEGVKRYFDNMEGMPSTCKWVIFTDAVGREGLYDENDSWGDGFFKEEKYGKKYPRYYYTFLRDNLLYGLRVSYYEYIDSGVDLESSTWLVDEENSYYTDNLAYCGYMDITDPSCDYYSTMFTQTLYNDDDKWEYWVEEFEVKDSSDFVYFDNGKYWKVCDYELIRKKFVLMNNDGVRLFEIPVGSKNYSFNYGSELYILKDEEGYYIAVQDKYGENGELIGFLTTYKIDKKTSQITKVSERESRLDVGATITGKGERLKISVDGGNESESVIVSDMSGKIVNTVDAKDEGTYINTGSMASGIYNVTLQSKAGMESKKIVIR